MWARRSSYRYAPFFMALLTNVGLFSTLMDALYADSQEKVRAWASYFHKYWFPALMARRMRRDVNRTLSGVEPQTPTESAINLIDRLLTMLQPKHPPQPKPSDWALRSLDAPMTESDDPARPTRPRAAQDDGELLCAQWGEPAPNPRAVRERTPNFPRLRWIDLLRRQRILLSNPEWGGVNYEGWWRDPDISPERLDDVARALQPPPGWRIVPPQSEGDLPRPERAPIQPVTGPSARDRRVIETFRLAQEQPEPKRYADDSRHPP
ncbi:MAG: hypothetical protein IPK79_10855 [Vampirovibrionales bacterium]|nr:hypothetical protein [Vampirovibrionales bacterium]